MSRKRETAGKSTAVSAIGDAGQHLCDEVHAAVAPGWELDERDELVLLHAARQADLIADLEAAIERDGVTVRGAAGQQRLHGGVTALIAARALLARLLAQIEVAPPAERTGHLSGRQRRQLRSARSADGAS